MIATCAGSEERQAFVWGLRGEEFDRLIDQLARREHELGRSLRVDFTTADRFERSIAVVERVTGQSFIVQSVGNSPPGPEKTTSPDSQRLPESELVHLGSRREPGHTRSRRYWLRPKVLVS